MDVYLWLKRILEILKKIKQSENYKIEEGKKPMEYPHNYEKFGDYIFPPEEINVGNESYTIYKARFNSLFDLYNYLKSDPKTNRIVFSNLASVSNDRSFAGKPYYEAVEDLIGDIDPGYKEFLTLQKDLNYASLKDIHKYNLVRTVAGGHLNIPAYSAGIKKPKFVRIHVTLSYSCMTTKKQVLNRAIIITNILTALEKAGYSVDLNVFELSERDNELCYIIVQIKRQGERMNMAALYKTLCRVEFLRRILFRILETLDVKNYWGSGYGSTCYKDFTKKVLKFGPNDIYFDQPIHMGIEGDDLAEDFESAIRYLNLEDKIDVEKAKEEFKKDVKSLKLKK